MSRLARTAFNRSSLSHIACIRLEGDDKKKNAPNHQIHYAVYHAERRLLTCNEPHAKFVLIEAKDLETKRTATKAFDAKWPSAIRTEILSVHLVSKLPAEVQTSTKGRKRKRNLQVQPPRTAPS
jgi:hypothetical protein